jgi:hypothetical protein
MKLQCASIHKCGSHMGFNGLMPLQWSFNLPRSGSSELGRQICQLEIHQALSSRKFMGRTRNTLGTNTILLAVQLPSLLCQVGNSLCLFWPFMPFLIRLASLQVIICLLFLLLCVVRFVPAFVPSFRHEISAAPPRGGL